jgi:elongation factor Ts
LAYSAEDVKRLRELTAAGMLDCKKALDEADGDFDKAVEIIRVKGCLLYTSDAADDQSRV